MTAKKDERGKPDLSLVPHCVDVAIAEALMDGEVKYGRYNYCKGHQVSKLLAAAKRHIGQFQDGEDIAADSGLSHLSHALANLAMIVHETQLGTLVDDRYKSAPQLEHDPIAPQGVLLPSFSLTERFYEIVATSRSGDIVLERCPDPILAVNRLDALRAEWPTFKLRIEECAANYEDDHDGERTDCRAG